MTVALACPPLAEAVIVALPAPRALTGIATLLCPELKLTLAGTVAACGLLLVTLSVPVAVGVGERVAVSVPLVPAASASGLGLSATGLGITTVNTVSVILVPVAPASCSAMVLLKSKVATRSTLVTPPAKSERLSTCVLLRFTESAVRLFAALSSTRTTYGLARGAGTLKLLEKEKRPW